MMEWLESVWEFLVHVRWGNVAVTVILGAVAVVGGIWWPARMMEEYTGQPKVRYIWYFVGTMTMVVIWWSMWSYGRFWNLYMDGAYDIG